MAGTNPFFTMSKNILASHANDRQNLSRLMGRSTFKGPMRSNAFAAHRPLQAHLHAFPLASPRRAPVPAAPVPAALGKRPGGLTAPGGARRDRTDDLLLAKQALSQLSYGPGRGQ